MGLPNRHRQNYNNVGRGLMVQVRDVFIKRSLRRKASGEPNHQ